MNRRTWSMLVAVSFLVGLVPLAAGAETSANVVEVTVEAPEFVFAPVNDPQLAHHPHGRGTCEGWEILNRYHTFDGGGNESELSIRLTPPAPPPTGVPFEGAEAILPSHTFLLLDGSSNVSRALRWGANAHPSGDPEEGSLVAFTLIRDLSECHGLEGDYEAFEASFSSQTPSAGSLVLAEPADACSALTNGSEVDGNIVLLTVGSCAYATAYENARAAGAEGVIFYGAGSPVVMGGAPSSNIPAVMVSGSHGSALFSAVSGGYTVNLTMDPTPTDTLSGPAWPVGAVLSGSSVTQTSLTVDWPAAVGVDGMVTGYTIFRGATELDTVDASATSFPVSGLTPGAEYTFSVVAHDSIGLDSEALVGQLSTASLTGPSWPGGATLAGSEFSDASLRITWPAALDDDGSIEWYRVYQDGGLIATVGGGVLTFLVQDLSPGAAYLFAVVAVDDDEVASPQLTGTFSTRLTDTVGAFNPNNGQWHLRNAAGVVTSFYFGNPGDIPMMGDWNCDGTDTVGLYRQSTGLAYIRNTNDQGGAHRNFFFGIPGDIPLAGDFNNDGCDTVSIYRPSQGRVFISNVLPPNGGSLGAQHDYSFGIPGDKPFVGDFNGNGTDTVGLHRESTGYVYFRNSHSQGNADAEFYFGIPNDRLVAGDWGIVNGVDTPAVFRPGITTWYFRHTNSQGNADSQFVWGQAHWLPVSGKFDLD